MKQGRDRFSRKSSVFALIKICRFGYRKKVSKDFRKGNKAEGFREMDKNALVISKRLKLP